MNSRQWRHLGLGLVATLVAVFYLASVGVAATGAPVTVVSGDVVLTLNGTFHPQALSKTVPTPITARLSGRVKTVDGGPVPALQQLVFDADRNLALDVRGLPICHPPQAETIELPNTCKDAIVGRGSAAFRIEFAEAVPVDATTELIVFNHGVDQGVTTLYIHGYLTVPTPAAIVATVKIRKIEQGHFGTEAVVSIPKVAGGSGSLVSLELTLKRKFAYRGEQRSFLTLKCPRSKTYFRSSALFDDGTEAELAGTRNCTPKP